MKFKVFSATFISAAAVLFCFLCSAIATDAQTQKRRTARPKQPVVVPVQPQNFPVVVSRAQDIPSENQIVAPEISQPIAQPPEETIDEKLDASNKRIKELSTRLKSLESTQKNEYDEKQKRLLLNLDILSRAEQRAESLRKQLFEIIEKESTVQTRLDQLKFDTRSENLERSAAFSGSMRPEDIRDQRKKTLEAERNNLEGLMTQIQNNRAALQSSVDKADAMVEKVRFKLEKDIDDALDVDKP